MAVSACYMLRRRQVSLEVGAEGGDFVVTRESDGANAVIALTSVPARTGGRRSGGCGGRFRCSLGWAKKMATAGAVARFDQGSRLTYGAVVKVALALTLRLP